MFPEIMSFMCLFFSQQTNTKLEKLDVTGNWLEAEGGVFVASMLKENMFITDFVRYKIKWQC